MLKIYRCTVEYELHNGDQIIHLSTDSDYVIKDESKVAPKTKEFGAYTEEAANVYIHSYNLRPAKKGMRASCWTWDNTVYLMNGRRQMQNWLFTFLTKKSLVL